MRALPAAAAIALLLVAAPSATATATATATGAGRLDVLGEQLRERPLAIDSELAWFFDAAQERRLVRTLRRSPVDFHVALVPQVEDDESGGDGHRIGAFLQRRLGRPGIYIVVDEHGSFDVGSYAVPREVSIPFELKSTPSVRARVPDSVLERLQRIAADVAAAPRGETTDRFSPRPLKPYENRRLRRYGESTGEVARDAAIAGGILGLFAGGLARLRTRRAAALQAPRPRRGRGGRRRR